MSLFAVSGLGAPLMAAGSGMSLGSGMLAGQILDDPAAFLPDDSILLLGLTSTSPVARQEAVQGARVHPDLWAAVDFVHSVEEGVELGEGTNRASFERARALLRRARSRGERALADPALPEDYRTLLGRLTEEQPRLLMGNPESMRALGGAAEELVARLIGDVSQAHASYDGLRSLESLEGMTEIMAVASAFEALYGRVVAEAFLDGVLKEALGALIDRERPGLLERYNDLGLLQLALENHQAQARFMTALPLSSEKIDAYWDLLALKHEMLSRPDFDNDSFLDLQVRMAHPNLSPEERARLVAINRKAENRLDRSDPLFHTEILEAIRTFYARMQAVDINSDPARKFDYFLITQELAGLALRFGVDAEAMRGVIAADWVAPETETVQLAEVQQVAREVSPEALPVEIRRCLELTGDWEMVAENARRIILVPEMGSTAAIDTILGAGQSFLGSALFVDGTVIVKTRMRGQQLSPWKIAALIAHEAAHVRWLQGIMDDQDRLFLLPPVPNEREAHAVETQFYLKYLTAAGEELSVFDQMALGQEIYQQGSKTYACNVMLGLPLLDLTPGQPERPDPELLASRFGHLGISSLGEMDLTLYPSRLRDFIGVVDFPHETDRRELEALKAHLRVLRAQASRRVQPPRNPAALAGGGVGGGSPVDLDALQQLLAQGPPAPG